MPQIMPMYMLTKIIVGSSLFLIIVFLSYIFLIPLLMRILVFRKYLFKL